MREARNNARKEKEKRHDNELKQIIKDLEPQKQRRVMRAKEGNTGFDSQ